MPFWLLGRCCCTKKSNGECAKSEEAMEIVGMEVLKAELQHWNFLIFDFFVLIRVFFSKSVH